MDIFESLENLNVSEECFNEIMGIVEELLSEKYEDGYEEAPSGHKHKIGDDVQVHFGAGLDGGKSGKISSLYKNHNGHTWAKGTGNDGDFDVPTSYLRTKKKVSESLYNEIADLVEEILSEEDVYEPAAYAKDGYNFMATGGNKLNGKLYKVHTKHDKGVTKTKLYAKDGNSACKLVQKAYGGPDSAHTLATESLIEEIIDITEAILLERNKANREAKKNWELQKRGGYHTDYLYDDDADKESNKYYQHSKKHEVGNNQNAIHSLKKYIGDDNPMAKSHAIDQLARSSRVILGREQDPVSYNHASEYTKNRSKEVRKEQSQRGSTKDSYTRVGAPEERKEPGEILKKQEEKK